MHSNIGKPSKLYYNRYKIFYQNFVYDLFKCVTRRLTNLYLFVYLLTERSDATQYGVVEDYVFTESCESYTKTVRLYAVLEAVNAKFQVCTLQCITQSK